MDLFGGHSTTTLKDLMGCLDTRRYAPGECVFGYGEQSDSLYLIRRGAVRIMLPVDEQQHHLATFGRGAFFGEMSFLDPGARSADAVAHVESEIFVLSRERFEIFAANHHRAALALMSALARALAVRLRSTNAEVPALQEG